MGVKLSFIYTRNFLTHRFYCAGGSVTFIYIELLLRFKKMYHFFLKLLIFWCIVSAESLKSFYCQAVFYFIVQGL